MSLLDLSLKNIFLVEEKNNGGGCKVPVVADAVEEVQALMHAVLEEATPKGLLISDAAIIQCYQAA